MTRRQAIATLRRAFAALPPEQRENLRWHAKNKTRVACGELWERTHDRLHH